MAERKSTININYKVNVAELERAAEVSRRAQQSTDNLRRSTQQFQQSTQGNKGVADSIAIIRTRMENLRHTIEGTSLADKKRLSDLTAQYRSLQAQVDNFNKTLKNQSAELKNVTQNTQATTLGFQQLYGALRTIFTAAIVREVVDLSLNMAELAGNVDGVSRAFSRLPNSELLLRQLRQATHGTLTDLQLMQQALRAQNFGIPLQNLGTFLEFAAIRAQQTGESVDYLVNSIVLGLGRNSIKILDNLQVDIGAMKKRMDEAGISVDEAFAEQVQIQMQRAGGYVENIGTEAARAKVEFHALRVAIANAVSGQNEQNLNIFSRGIEGLRRFIEASKFELLDFILVWRLYVKTGDAILEVSRRIRQEKIEELAAEGALAVQREASAKQGQEQFDFVQQEINSRQQLIGRYNDEINKRKELLSTIDAGNVANQKRIDTLFKEISAWDTNKSVIEETIKLLLEYIDTIRNADQNILGLVARQRKIIEGLQKSIEEATDERALANFNRQLIFAEARLNDLLALGTKTIDLKINVKLSHPRLVQELIQPFVNANGEVVRYERNVTNAIQNTTNSFLNYQDVLDRIEANLKNLSNINIPAPKFTTERITFFDELGTEFVDNWQAITSEVVDIHSSFLADIQKVEAANFSRRIDRVRDFYDEQIKLAGDNERAKERLAIQRDRKLEELERREFERNKRAQRSTTLINGAAAIVKAFLTAPNYVVAVIQAALIAAETAIQLDAINRAKFAKGKINIQGPGTGTSDSIPAMISKGETVTTAKDTANSMAVLKDVHARKLNDKVYKELLERQGKAKVISEDILKALSLSPNGVSVSSMDDSRIVSEIRSLKASMPNYESVNGMLYRSYHKNSNYKKRIRSKSF